MLSLTTSGTALWDLLNLCANNYVSSQVALQFRDMLEKLEARDLQPLAELDGSIPLRRTTGDLGGGFIENDILRRNFDDLYERRRTHVRRGGSIPKTQKCIGGCLKKPSVKIENISTDPVADLYLDVPQDPQHNPESTRLFQHVVSNHHITGNIHSESKSLTSYNSARSRAWNPDKSYQSQGRTKRHSRDTFPDPYANNAIIMRNIGENSDDDDPSNTRHHKRGNFFSKCFGGDCLKPSGRNSRPNSSSPEVYSFYSSTQNNPDHTKGLAKDSRVSRTSSPLPKVLSIGPSTEYGGSRPVGEGTSSSSVNDHKKNHPPGPSRTSGSHEKKQHYVRDALPDAFTDTEIVDDRELFSRAMDDLYPRISNLFLPFAERLHHRRGGLITKCLGGKCPEPNTEDPATRTPRWLDSARNRESARNRDSAGGQKVVYSLLNILSGQRTTPAQLPKDEIRLGSRPPLYGKSYTKTFGQQHNNRPKYVP